MDIHILRRTNVQIKFFALKILSIFSIKGSIAKRYNVKKPIGNITSHANALNEDLK
jgi:hypothetical protein